MSYDHVTVKCSHCGVRITGRRDLDTGLVYPARHPRNDTPEVMGLCESCARKPRPSPAQPEPGSWADVARAMAQLFPGAEIDWDAWKDEMKERDDEKDPRTGTAGTS